MGYYINWPGVVKGKANHLLMNEKATEVLVSDANICVVENDLFDAVVYLYSERERQDFADPKDRRPKRWFRIDDARAQELSGFK